MNAMLSYAVEHLDGLVKFCTARGVWPQDAEDVVQDVIVKLLRAKPPTNERGPRAYVLQTVRNAITDRTRRAQVVRFEPMEQYANHIGGDVAHEAEVNLALEEAGRVIQADTPKGQEAIQALLTGTPNGRHRSAIYRLRRKLRAAEEEN